MPENTPDAKKLEEDRRRLNRLKVLWPASELGGGFNKAYFSTYSQYMYTNVYRMSTVFSGLLSTVQLLIGWLGAPIFATFLDKFSFKKSKYWPWIVIGNAVVYTGWILLFSLPLVLGIKIGEGGEANSTIGALAFVLAAVISLAGPMASVPISAVYPQMSADPKDRQFFAVFQKIGRDGGKTVFGFLVPMMLLFFAADKATPDANSYAVTALIIGAITIALYWALALFGLRGSYVERAALERAASGRKGISIPVMFKTIFTNRPLLSMFLFMSLHKAYYFIYVTCAAYVFRYRFGNFALMSTFNSIAFNLTAIIGVVFGPLWSKLFGETKRAFVAGMIVHVGILLVIAIMFPTASATMFMVMFGASSFFMGLLENFIMPLFAASSDYGAWKAGNRLDGLSMSIYSLSITTGSLIATLIRTPVLASYGLDEIAKAGENASSMPGFARLLSGLSTLYGWIPLGLGVAALAILALGFNLNDKRLAAINADLKEGRTAATSSTKF